MIETREHLIHVLTEAAEIEHNLLCSYLYAAFSIKRAGEPGLSEAQGEAVERWRSAILTICRQEMAHLASVNNLLIAIGGAPHFNRANFPVPPGYHPAGLVVRLTPFNRDTLEHFIFVERAEDIPLADAEGFEAENVVRKPRPGGFTPSAHDYDTIGALYEAISEGFRAVADRLGEHVLIHPAGLGQLDGEKVQLIHVDRLTSLKAALAAIDHIKEEGEGSKAAGDDSHFHRFCAIKREWDQLIASEGAFEPAWPAASDPVMRRPAEGLERVWITAEPAASWLDLGNAVYGAMLQVLAHAFADGNSARRTALIGAAVELMEATGAIGSAVARLPASSEHPGINAGLSFAVPRNLGVRPAVEGRDIMAERVAELRVAAQETLDGETHTKVLRRLGAALDVLIA